ncbi:MAG: NAD(P)H-dependent oxidoreductase [Lachnospiraceae bacterium]|nr:NAD(P)H-dependent oxidoreductase [Lachnospiraceae bacterium]
MILYIDACARENSRTRRLAEALLTRLQDEVSHIRLFNMNWEVTDENYLRKRDALIAEGLFDDDMFAPARQFAQADTVVIAAPYWDLSFPAVLKQYIEAINVLGITFEYTEDGFPRGLCKADKLYYVMTAGGNFVPEEFGYGYIRSLSENFYGIKDVRLIKATGLDIYGADAEAILQDAIKEIS